MRQLGIIGLGLGLLTLAGAVNRLLHLELLRPDPVLALVVMLGLRSGPIGAVTTFCLGLLADSFAGLPGGALTSGYLVVWCLVWLARRMLLRERWTVQAGLLLVSSLVASLAQVVLLTSLPGVEASFGHLLGWMVPLALLNLVVAWPVWALAGAILERPRARGAFAPG